MIYKNDKLSPSAGGESSKLKARSQKVSPGGDLEGVYIPLQIIDLHEDGFHPLIEITVFGKPFILVLDTGASKTAFDQTMLLRVNESADITVSDRLSTGLGTNSMASSTTIINDLIIGDLLIPEFEVAVLDLSAINIAYRQLGHPEVLGVLGGDILMKYKAVIDYGNKVLLLRNHTFPS